MEKEIEYRAIGKRIEILDQRGGRPRRSTISCSLLVDIPAGIIKTKMIPRALMPGVKTTKVAPGIDAPIRRVSQQPKRKKPKKTPGPIRRAANFAKAGAKHICSGSPKASLAVIQERFAICAGCDSFQPTGEGTGLCTEITCGCNLANDKRPVNKLGWADQECPLAIKKWGRVDGK